MTEPAYLAVREIHYPGPEEGEITVPVGEPVPAEVLASAPWLIEQGHVQAEPAARAAEPPEPGGEEEADADDEAEGEAEDEAAEDAPPPPAEGEAAPDAEQPG